MSRGEQGPGSWRIVSSSQMCNVLGVGMSARRAAPWLTADEIAQARACASELAAVSTALPFWAPLGASGWELVEGMNGHHSELDNASDDLAEWTLHHVVLPALRWHLEALPTLSADDRHYSTSFASEVLRVSYDEHLRYQISAPLSGIDLASPHVVMTEGDISIRRLSDEEQGEWFMEHEGPPMFTLLGTEPPLVLLELNVAGPRNSQHMPAGGHMPFLIAALQLHGHEVASKSITEHSQPKWLQPFAVPAVVTLPRRSHPLLPSQLTAESFHSITETAARLSRFDIVQPKTSQDLALHRFISAKSRTNDVDAILDSMIGLEALLVPGSNPGDISYRFSIHGAHYLADHVSGRESIRGQLRDIYKMRNNFVHGNKYPKHTEIAATRLNAENLLRNGLLRAIYEGFPTPETFAQMLLGLATT